MSKGSESNGKTILVVDDDESVGIVFKTLLEKEGFTVHAALDGDEALAIVREKKVHLIILDWMMPVFTGFEVLKKLQVDEEHRKIPVVIITARVTDQQTIETIKKEINVVEFTFKPVNPEFFVSLTHQILKTGKK